HEGASDLEKTPDRRGWERVGRTLLDIPNVTEIHLQLLAGIIGISSAVALYQSLQTTPALTPEDLLLRFSKTKKALETLSFPERTALNEQALHWLQSGSHTASQTDTLLKNFHQYLLWLEMNSERESIAQIASLLESPSYGEAAAFLLGESDDIREFITRILEEIDLL
ncbi:MAG: hypothetical protein AAF191_20200, partial [Verrucomicrobiota bacterium]